RSIARAPESTANFRLWIFGSGAAHARDLRQRKNPLRDLLPGLFFDLVDRDCVADVESTGLRPSQRFQMRAAAKQLANIMRVSADIETLAAKHAEIDVWQRDPVDAVTIDVNEAWFALHDFSLPRQFVERHAPMF